MEERARTTFCQMVLYCSPDVWVMKRYNKQSGLKNEKEKTDNRVTCFLEDGRIC
jgi:hypothetical protein